MKVPNCSTAARSGGDADAGMIVVTVSNEFAGRCAELQHSSASLLDITENVHGMTTLQFCDFAFFRRPGNFRRFPGRHFSGFRPAPRNVAQNARCRNSLGARAALGSRLAGGGWDASLEFPYF